MPTSLRGAEREVLAGSATGGRSPLLERGRLRRDDNPARPVGLGSPERERFLEAAGSVAGYPVVLADGLAGAAPEPALRPGTLRSPGHPAPLAYSLSSHKNSVVTSRLLSMWPRIAGRRLRVRS